MFTFTQSILTQLLAIKNTTPERLSTHEAGIAARICHCTVCGYLWVRKFLKLPNRCPHCHASAWDRPLLSAMIAAAQPPITTPTRQEEQKPKGETT